MTFVANAQTFKQLIKARDQSLYEVWLFLASKLKRKVKVDRGLQRASITVNKRELKQGKITVGSNLIQARIEEYWREPGKFPQLDPLVWWTARKGFHKAGQSKKYNQLGKNKRYTSKWKLSAKTKEELRAKFITYRVWVGIAENGIKKTQVYSKTMQQQKERLEKLFIFKIKKYGWIT